MQNPASGYPINFDVPYPEGARDRQRVALRIFYAIPILIVLAVVGGSGTVFDQAGAAQAGAGAAGGVLFLGPLLMILFRQKYPRWWWEWNLQITRFSNRVASFMLLLRDEYPATDDDQAVSFDMPYPDAQTDLVRWMPLVKWFLAIPHFILLFFLAIAAVVVTIIAWFAILFTGQHPRGMHKFSLGVLRWANRVNGYAFMLVTDKYPPFSLEP